MLGTTSRSARVDQMSQVLAVTDLEVAIGIVVEVALEVPEMIGNAVVVVRVTHDDELGPLVITESSTASFATVLPAVRRPAHIESALIL